MASGHAHLVEKVDPSCSEVVRHAIVSDGLVSSCLLYTSRTCCVLALFTAGMLLGFGINVWIFGMSLSEDGVFVTLCWAFTTGAIASTIVFVVGGLILTSWDECKNYYERKRQDLIQKKETAPTPESGSSELTEMKELPV